MRYLCIKCKSDFELEKDASDIFCPYCGYLAKSDDRNAFYEKIHIIKPVMSKREFIISQLEKMAQIQDTPKDIFDNLSFNVKEKYVFFAERKFNAKASYDASVKYKKEEKYTSYVESVHVEKDGTKVTRKEPKEEVRIVDEVKVVSDNLNSSGNLIVNFKGTKDKDLDLIRDYYNDFEEDNSIEIPMSVVRIVLNSFDDDSSKVDESFDLTLADFLNKKVLELNSKYDDCSNINININEKEYGEYKLYCIIKYVWEYKYGSNNYSLSMLSPIKHVYGDYPGDKAFDLMVKQKQEAIKKKYKGLRDGVNAISGIFVIILGILIAAFAASKDHTNDDKTMIIFLICVFIGIIIGLAVLLNIIFKRIENKKSSNAKRTKYKEKAERKAFMRDKTIQDIKDDKYKI